MASGEAPGRFAVSSPSSSSATGLEALFAAGAGRADGSPELRRLCERLRVWLEPQEAAVLELQRLLVWERPLHSACVALTLNTVFWFVSSTSLRPLFLLSVTILALVVLDRWKHKLPSMTGTGVPLPEALTGERESLAGHHHLLSVPELSHHIAESYFTFSLYVQEMLQYKRQNPGKFCMWMCTGCLGLGAVGHYIPGIMVSYIILLSVLLWPLVVYHELIQKMYTGLEPVLMKLEYSMKGDTQHRKLDKKKTKREPEQGDAPQAETESESEEELSCFTPTVDVKTTALAMAITDSELSDEEASILESGGFSVSRAATPQLSDVSEDMDQQSMHSEPEETFSQDLPEFPSVDEFSIDPGVSISLPQGAESANPASLLIQHLASPLHFVNTHFNGQGRQPGAAGSQAGTLSLEALSEEIVSTAISTVVQNTLTAMLRSSEASEGPSIAEFLPTESSPGALQAAEEELKDEDDVAMETAAIGVPTAATTEDEDFELLDQSELEQMDEELGLGSQEPEPDKATPTCDTGHQTQES